MGADAQHYTLKYNKNLVIKKRDTESRYKYTPQDWMFSFEPHTYKTCFNNITSSAQVSDFSFFTETSVKFLEKS
jgi:hypothetical protein